MKIDVRKKAGEIPALWFGHNLEHTRGTMFEGLCAELIRNRKFVGSPGRDGVAHRWYRIGPPGCLFLLERPRDKWGMYGEPYTRHFDPNVQGAMQRQRIQCFEGAGGGGIGQGGIHLTGGRTYEGRAVMLSDRPLRVRIRICGEDRSDAHFEATVTVDTDKWTEHPFSFASPATDENARIEIALDGAGMLCIGAVSLMEADHFHGMRRDVIELLKEVGVPIFRWPGGNFAGAYRWKDGLLPPDQRPPLWGAGILPHTDGYDDHAVGTDEFVALCRELDAEPWITINMSLEDPVEDCASWVEYCNGPADTHWGQLRAQAGHPEPYIVRYWSLGNEMGWPHMRGADTPTEYAELATACARTMREADPSIVLVASDGPDMDEWYTTVPAKAGECFDHISYHEYTDLMKVYEGEDGRSEFRRRATAPARTLEVLKRVRAHLDSHAPGGKSIGISFDEWNIWWTWFRRPGVVEGIFTAAMLNMIVREGRKVGMTFGAYYEPVSEGAILVEPASCRLTPPGEVFSLFKSHHGNELLEADPPADSPLDAAASIDEATREVIITLVNTDCETEARTELVLTNVEGIGEARGTVLRSSGFLPESEFVRGELDVTPQDDCSLSLVLPPHSVAAVRIRYL